MVVLLAMLLAQQTDARPKQGDKTLNLSMTEIRFATGTEQACDEDGQDCEDTIDVNAFEIGFGAAAAA
jgi:hypothetical protein